MKVYEEPRLEVQTFSVEDVMSNDISLPDVVNPDGL